MIVVDYPSVTAWVAERAEVLLSPSDMTSVGLVAPNGDVRGGVLFHNYTGPGGSVTVHMAGEGTHWATRDFLWTVFDYAFTQLGVAKIIGPVPSTNDKALEVDLRLGFVPEARIEGVYPDGDMLILSMTRDRCRWLRHTPKTFGRRYATLAA